MIKKLLFFLALFMTTVLFAQPFEGKLTYKNTYKSKMRNVTDQKLTAIMGDTQENYIKGGNYKSVANGSFFQWQLYLNDENKVYRKMVNSEVLQWSDGSINQDQVLKVKVNKGVTEILGYKCDELIMTCESGVQKYYFNSQLSVDAKLFKQHKYGNWYEFLSRSKSLPLKCILDNAQFTLESTACEVKPMQLDKNIFVLAAKTKDKEKPALTDKVKSEYQFAKAGPEKIK